MMPEKNLTGRITRILLLMLTAIVFAGCAHAISKEYRDAASSGVSVEDIFRDPEANRGMGILIGGIIAGSANTNEGTYLEVVEKPLNRYGRPVDADISRGRFFILYAGYLDPLIYGKGRIITIAGEVRGRKSGVIGSADYQYPLIQSRELHLFKEDRESPVRFGIGIGIGGSF